MNKRLLLTAALLILVMIPMMPAYSQGHHPPPKPPCPPVFPPPHILVQLELENTVIEAIDDLEYTLQSECLELDSKIREAELKLDYALRRDTIKQKDVMTLVDELNQARGDLFKAHITARIAFREVIGKDAFQTLKTLMKGPPCSPRPKQVADNFTRYSSRQKIGA